MNLYRLLENYLLNEKGGLETFAKEIEAIIKNLDGLGSDANLLKRTLQSLNNLDPAAFAKLEREGVDIEKLLAKAEKATASDADMIAKEIEDSIKVKSSTNKVNRQNISPEQQVNKDFDALIARADKLEKDGQLRAAINIKRRAYQMIGEEFEEATKLPSVKADQWSKLNAQRTDLLKNPNTPKQIIKDLEREMDSIYPRSSWQKISQWARENPKKAWLFGFLGASALGTIGYQASKFSPSPTPKPEPTPGPNGGGGGKGGGTKWKKCDDTEIKKGCTGDNVRVVQSYLDNMGYDLGKQGVDSKFGSNTESALKKFQKDNGLSPTGKVNQETLDKIEEVRTGGKKTTEQTPVPEKSEQTKKEPQVVDVPATEKDKEEFNKAKSDFEKAQAEREELKKTVDSYRESLIRKRNSQIEKLVFERLVKNAN